MPYDGKRDGIFLYTKETAVADEVMLDFVERVMSSMTSFTGFCTQKTMSYKSVYSEAKFMSRSTFILLFFVWAHATGITIEKFVDPYCLWEPKFLTGDGTHIGVPLRQVSMVAPVTARVGEVSGPTNRRKDRRFMPTESGQEALRKLLGHFTSETPCADIQQQKEQVLDSIDQDARCRSLFEALFSGQMPSEIKLALCRVLELASNQSSVTTILPYRLGGKLLEMTTEPKYCSDLPELSRLLQVAHGSRYQPTVERFLFYLWDRVCEVHSDETIFAAAVASPPRDVMSSASFYCFTEHGGQVREIPKYGTDQDRVGGGSCTKGFNQPTYRDWTYLWLWFCPLHGHCYGFHIIDGAEGRKDPFCSLVKFLPTMPREIFYDFSCQLMEYSLNREPELFKNTRFWQDVFHTVNHKACGKNFTSRRISHLNVFDTEIAEQTNSFLNKLKFTATHMSQEHFLFFVNFFLGIWNKRKSDKAKKSLATAVSFLSVE